MRCRCCHGSDVPKEATRQSAYQRRLSLPPLPVHPIPKRNRAGLAAQAQTRKSRHRPNLRTARNPTKSRATPQATCRPVACKQKWPRWRRSTRAQTRRCAHTWTLTFAGCVAPPPQLPPPRTHSLLFRPYRCCRRRTIRRAGQNCRACRGCRARLSVCRACPAPSLAALARIG
jgi:hypothetical protein